jgi:hypothetical protein
MGFVIHIQQIFSPGEDGCWISEGRTSYQMTLPGIRESKLVATFEITAPEFFLADYLTF